MQRVWLLSVLATIAPAVSSADGSSSGWLAEGLPSIELTSPSIQKGGQDTEENAEKVEHRHEVALIIAGTYEGNEQKSFFTTGIEYQYRISPLVGIGAVGEAVIQGDGRDYTYVFPVYFHPAEAIELLVGPGFERSDDRSNFLFRVGVAYEVELGERYSIAPSIELDFVNDEDGVSHALVYGVNFGVAF